MMGDGGLRCYGVVICDGGERLRYTHEGGECVGVGTIVCIPAFERARFAVMPANVSGVAEDFGSWEYDTAETGGRRGRSGETASLII
jgi:hypothetical protein